MGPGSETLIPSTHKCNGGRFVHTGGMSQALKAGILYKMFMSWARMKARLELRLGQKQLE